MRVILASVVMVGCVGSDPTLPQPPTELSAHDTFVQKSWPALATCNGCHGTQPAIQWLAPGTADGAYVTVFAFQPPVVNLDSPESSLVLTMGKHTGPALPPDQAAIVLDWLQKERDERIAPVGEPIVVGPLTAQLDAVNAIDLGHGATMHFRAAAFDGHLDVAQVDISTTAALHVSHPLFVSRPRLAAPIVDEADHYDDIDAQLPTGATLPLVGATFLDFAASDPITIHFQALEAP
jgi:hypothetical protein